MFLNDHLYHVWSKELDLMITNLSVETLVKHPCHLVISINDTTDQLLALSVSI